MYNSSKNKECQKLLNCQHCNLYTDCLWIHHNSTCKIKIYKSTFSASVVNNCTNMQTFVRIISWGIREGEGSKVISMRLERETTGLGPYLDLLLGRFNLEAKHFVAKWKASNEAYFLSASLPSTWASEKPEAHAREPFQLPHIPRMPPSHPCCSVVPSTLA
jgi:hypothetical protein